MERGNVKSDEKQEYDGAGDGSDYCTEESKIDRVRGECGHLKYIKPRKFCGRKPHVLLTITNSFSKPDRYELADVIKWIDDLYEDLVKADRDSFDIRSYLRKECLLMKKSLENYDFDGDDVFYDEEEYAEMCATTKLVVENIYHTVQALVPNRTLTFLDTDSSDISLQRNLACIDEDF